MLVQGWPELNTDRTLPWELLSDCDTDFWFSTNTYAIRITSRVLWDCHGLDEVVLSFLGIFALFFLP